MMSAKPFLDMPQLGDRFSMLDRYPAWFQPGPCEKQSSISSQTTYSSDCSLSEVTASTTSSVATTVTALEESFSELDDEHDIDVYEVEDENEGYGQTLELGTAVAVLISSGNQPQMVKISGKVRTGHGCGRDKEAMKASSVNIRVDSRTAEPVRYVGTPQIVTISAHHSIPPRNARRQGRYFGKLASPMREKWQRLTDDTADLEAVY